MKLWLNMALNAVRVNRGFSLFFVLNLSIGLAGFVAVQSFGRSMDRHMDRNLKEILTADMVLSSSSPMTEQERALTESVLGGQKELSRLVAFYSMVRPGRPSAGGQNGGEGLQARLVRIMAVDSTYPLYGKFVLEGAEMQALFKRGPFCS